MYRDPLIRALNRHQRGWALVRWTASYLRPWDSLLGRPSTTRPVIVIVQDGDEQYPADLKELKNPVTLPNRVKTLLGIPIK